MDPRPLRPLTAVPPLQDGVDGPDRDWISDYRARTDEAHRRAELIRRDLEAVSATATSRDGAVEATVDASGALTGLRFGPCAAGVAPERLAELVLDAAGRAARTAALQVRALVDDPTPVWGRRNLR